MPCIADNVVEVCRGYGCLAQDPVVFSSSDLVLLGKKLSLATSASEERVAISIVVGNMYQLAGRQSLIRFDRAGNYFDDHPAGKMDCIDHSQTTTRFLKLLELGGYLRWHRVLDPVRRTSFYMFDHFSAAVEAKGPGEEPKRFVIDSWFVEQGEPALVFPLQEWMQGAGPDV